MSSWCSVGNKRIYTGGFPEDEESKLECLKKILHTCTPTTLVRVQKIIEELLIRDFIGELPGEVSMMIFAFLDLKTLTQVALVSHKWNQVLIECGSLRQIACRRLSVNCNLEQERCRSTLASVYRRSRQRSWFYPVSTRGTDENRTFNSEINCTSFGKVLEISFDNEIPFRRSLNLATNWDISCVQIRGEDLFCGSFMGIVLRFRSEDRFDLIREYFQHAGAVLCVDSVVELNLVLSGGMDRVVKVWNMQNGVLLRVVNSFENPTQQISILKMHQPMTTTSTDSNVGVAVVSILDCTLPRYSSESSNISFYHLNKSDLTLIEKTRQPFNGKVLLLEESFAHLTSNNQIRIVRPVIKEGEEDQQNVQLKVELFNVSVKDGERLVECCALGEMYLTLLVRDCCLEQVYKLGIFQRRRRQSCSLRRFDLLKEIILNEECRPKEIFVVDRRWLDGFDQDNNRGIAFFLIYTKSFHQLNWYSLDQQ